MNARLEENLGAQIVAEAGHETLIEQQSRQLPPPKARLIQTRGEIIRGRRLRQDIGAESAQIGMATLPRDIEHLDLRRRVQQSPPIAAANGEAELPSGLRQAIVSHHIPETIELIVGIDAESTFEARQHPFAARGHLVDPLADELSLVGLEPVEREEHIVRDLAPDG